MKKQYVAHHKDGSVLAKGDVIDGLPAGYWEWFRLDGTKMRSGYFKDGNQVGKWTTYDKLGRAHKTTNMDKASHGSKKTNVINK